MENYGINQLSDDMSAENAAWLNELDITNQEMRTFVADTQKLLGEVEDQTVEVNILRDEWEKLGNPSCEHRALIQQATNAGRFTGVYVCVRCGKEVVGS